jgi:hypothetical protein
VGLALPRHGGYKKQTRRTIERLVKSHVNSGFRMGRLVVGVRSCKQGRADAWRIRRSAASGRRFAREAPNSKPTAFIAEHTLWRRPLKVCVPGRAIFDHIESAT